MLTRPARSLNSAVHDALTPLQRHCLVAAVLVAHGAVAWGLMQVREEHSAVALAAPMFFELIAPAAPSLPAAPPTLPPPTPQPTKSTLKSPTQPASLIIATPRRVPAPTLAPPPPPPPPRELPPTTEPPLVATLAPPALPAPPAPPVPAPPPAPPPKLIPASAVQYIEPPAPEYPRTSRRLGEAGRVLLRVYIDEAGLPGQVLVAQSSGFARLDEAALAAMKKARFKPYTENGQAAAGWAPAPIDFELE